MGLSGVSAVGFDGSPSWGAITPLEVMLREPREVAPVATRGTPGGWKEAV